MSSDPATRPQGGDLIQRHRFSTRLWHWVRAVVMIVMLMSGLMIFNAHPRLYWGQYGANPDPAWLEIGATKAKDKGYLRVAGTEFNTTGTLGLSAGPYDTVAKRAFPGWATLPTLFDLAAARRWHLSFAWILVIGSVLFGLWGLASGHVRRKLLPHRHELSPRHIWQQLIHHAMLRFPKGETACEYNVLQKFSYLGVSVILVPALILSGLTMSPWINAVAPWLLDLFGGRQSARSIHFIAAFLIVLFVIVHLLMMVATGPINEMRSMITGWYRVPKERDK